MRNLLATILVLFGVGALAQTGPPYFVPAGTYLKEISVVEEGARCDGVTDDSVILNRVMTVPGRRVSIPPGRTCVTSAPVVMGTAGVHLIGPGTLQISATYSSGQLLQISASDIVVDGVTLDGAALHVGDTTRAIFIPAPIARVALRNLLIKNFSLQGIVAASPAIGSYYDDWEINNVTVENVGFRGFELPFFRRLKADRLVAKATGSDSFFLDGTRDSILTNLQLDQSSLPYRIAQHGNTTFATSTTSRAITLATGVTFAVPAAAGWSTGLGTIGVLIASQSDRTKRMVGKITAYSGTTLTVDIVDTLGNSGTFADWVIVQWAGFIVFTGPYNEYLTLSGFNFKSNIMYLADGLGIGETGSVSTTSVTIAAGASSHSWVTSNPNGFRPGARFIAYSRASPNTNYMVGTVTSWTPGTSTVVVSFPSDGKFGSGTHIDWTVSEEPIGLIFANGVLQDVAQFGVDMNSNSQYDNIVVENAYAAFVVTFDTGGTLRNIRGRNLTARNPRAIGLWFTNHLSPPHIAFRDVDLDISVIEDKPTKVAVGVSVDVTATSYENVQLRGDVSRTLTPYLQNGVGVLDIRLAGNMPWHNHAEGNGGALVAGSNAAGFTQYTTYIYATGWQRDGRKVTVQFSIFVVTKGTTGPMLLVPPVNARSDKIQLGTAVNAVTHTSYPIKILGAVITIPASGTADPIADTETILAEITYEAP